MACFRPVLKGSPAPRAGLGRLLLWLRLSGWSAFCWLPLGTTGLFDFNGCFTRVSTTHSFQKSVLRRVCCLLIDSDSLAVLIALSNFKSGSICSFSNRAAICNPMMIQLCIISFCSAPYLQCSDRQYRSIMKSSTSLPSSCFRLLNLVRSKITFFLFTN